jgi:hypothetical protein
MCSTLRLCRSLARLGGSFCERLLPLLQLDVTGSSFVGLITGKSKKGKKGIRPSREDSAAANDPAARVEGEGEGEGWWWQRRGKHGPRYHAVRLVLALLGCGELQIVRAVLRVRVLTRALTTPLSRDPFPVRNTCAVLCCAESAGAISQFSVPCAIPVLSVPCACVPFLSGGARLVVHSVPARAATPGCTR